MRKKIKKTDSLTKTTSLTVAMNEMLLMQNLPGRWRPMSFPEMVKKSEIFKQISKNLGWLFPPICHRKDQASFTEIERSRYICAFNMINNHGTLGELVDIHHGFYGQHSNLLLLPWHRIFLMLFEEALHYYHPDVCIPYWDWTRAEEQSFPDWLLDVHPDVHTPTTTLTVIRSPQSSANLASITSMTPTAMAKTNYTDFSSWINGIHGSIHGWVGGTMSSPATSPADPVFWLHHANLDRLWWVWYNNAATGNHQNPVLADPVIHPWTYTEPQTRNIIPLGYNYV
jgi:tyrosinase